MGYESLFRRYKNQDRRTAFAHFPWKGDQSETWETPFTRLVELAKPEDWNFSNVEFTRNNESYPILTNYLNYTFLQLQEQRKVVFSDDGDRACFNTGLQTTTEKDIFATFFRNKKAEEFNSPDWTLYGFFDSYSQKLKDFCPIPEVASYIPDPSELVFDFEYEIDINYDHILEENQDRLPEILQQNKRVAISSIQETSCKSPRCVGEVG